MKKFLSMLLAVAMVVTLISAIAITPASAADGDWEVYAPPEQTQEDYEGVDKAVPGYEYTKEGFHTIPAEYIEDTPWVGIHTKNPVPLDDGVYMEVRIDNFSYEGSDKWFNIAIWDSATPAPPSANYGKGIQTLIRPRFDEEKQQYYVEPIEWYIEEFSRKNSTNEDNEKPDKIYVGEDGSITLTLELKYEGGLYKLEINGAEAPLDATMWINDYFTNKMGNEGYICFMMQNTAKNGSAECTITKFGTSKATAKAPAGDDSKDPVAGEAETPAPIADSATVPEGQPCFMLTGDKTNSATRTIGSGAGDTWRINDDMTASAVTVNDSYTRLIFSIKSEVSYDIDDFPVMLVLTKNYCTCDDPESCFAVESVVSHLMTGESIGAGADNKTPELDVCWEPLVVSEGEKAGQYLYFYYDTTDDLVFEATGRINSVYLDFSSLKYQEAGRNVATVDFIAFFRNVDEADAFVLSYLGLEEEEEETTEETTEEIGDVTTEDPDAVTTEAPDDVTTEAAGGEDKTEAPTSAPTGDDKPGDNKPSTGDKTDDNSSSGCGGFIGAGAIVLIATVALCGVKAFGKKD